ncbi:MAG: hypothetical protein IH881_12025 [Myxococcales bacterium]|nr:hypothetical protein [Myxococcales bacterium]
MDPATETLLRFATSLICLLLIAVSLRAKFPPSDWRAKTIAVTAAALALLTFYNFGAVRHYQGDGFVNYHEHFHYYLGAKYFSELGYDGLYAASLAAHRESLPNTALPKWVRDLRTNTLVLSEDHMVYADSIAARFTPERWQQFVSDRNRIHRFAPAKVNRAIHKDHGFNPTPTWVSVARLITALVTPGPMGSGILCLLDIVLASLMFVLIGRTYGSRVLCASLVVFGLGFGWRYVYVGALMRLDWLVAVVSAFCMLERKRPALAGMMLGYATATRLFPALLLAGPALLALKAWRRRERPEWPLQLFGAFAATVALGLLAGTLSGRGFAGWSEFVDNMRMHVALVSPMTFDLNTALHIDPLALTRALVTLTPMPGSSLPAMVERHGLVLPALRLGFIVLFCLAAWRASLVESAVLGLALIFALTPVTSYYWVVLLALPLLPGRLAPLVPVIFAAFLYGHEVMSGPFRLVDERRYAISLCLALFFALWLGRRASQAFWPRQ